MKEKNGEHPLGDTGQLLLLGLFFIVWIADSFFLKASTRLSVFIPLYVRLITFVLAFLTGFFLYRSGHEVVSHGRRSDGVVTAGAFRYVRHPLYLASMLVYLGLAISTASLVSLALLALVFLFYNYIAGYEEKLLELRFGEEYRAYAGRTGKWIPGIGKKR